MYWVLTGRLFIFFNVPQVTRFSMTSLSSEDQEWQLTRMTGINSSWLPRSKCVFVYLFIFSFPDMHHIELIEICARLLFVCASIVLCPVDHAQSRVSGRPELYIALVWRPSFVRIHLPLKRLKNARASASSLISVL